MSSIRPGDASGAFPNENKPTQLNPASGYRGANQYRMDIIGDRKVLVLFRHHKVFLIANAVFGIYSELGSVLRGNFCTWLTFFTGIPYLEATVMRNSILTG
jgi:hypothetical protein